MTVIVAGQETAHGSSGTVDALAFREAMSRFGAAVHVAATDGPAGRFGATVSAVASVSDAPPTLLVCLSRRGRMNAAVKANGVFSINTLPAQGEALAHAFAGHGDLPMDVRFGLAGWSALATGAPVLNNARVAIDCRVTEFSEVGSHSVIFGTVAALRLGARGPALIYLDRTYRHL